MSNLYAGEEFVFLRNYAQEVFELGDVMLILNQLRSLWTAYCIHQDMEVDTLSYDQDLLVLWETVEKAAPKCEHTADFDAFDAFMCELLV